MCIKSSAGFLVSLVVLLAVPVIAQTAPGQNAIEEQASARAEAYRLFLLGRHLAGEDDIEGAVRSYREASQRDLESGEILAELSSLYSSHDRSEEAIAAAQAALQREPTNQSAHRILGLVYAAQASGREPGDQDASLAIQHLEQARDTLLPDFYVEMTLARLYLGNDASDKAITLLQDLRKDEPGFSETGLLLARAYEQAGRMDDAVATLEQVVQGGRPSARALRRLGELYERDRRWGDAVEIYEQAVERNPRSARTRRQLANALVRDGQAERARDVLNELVAMRPNDASGLYLLSEVELELGNVAEAESAARLLIEAEPEGIRGAFALAAVFGQRREHQRVIDTLDPLRRTARDRALRPDQVASLLGRVGFAYEQLQDHEGASRIYEEGVELMPASLAFGARLAQAYISAGQLTDARRVLRQVREHHPEDLAVARLEARVLGDEGDIDAGEDVLQAALATRSSEPVAYLALAGFYSDYERLDGAVELLESAETRFPNDTSILFQLGAVLEQSDRHADAERSFRRVLDRDPQHAATLNYLGYMLADRGDRLDESVSLLERAIKIDPHNGAYLDSLGWAYFKLDRFDLAEMLLLQASEQMEWNSVIQDHLGDLMLKLERYAAAVAAWERALAGDGEEVERSTIERKLSDARRRLGR